MCSLWKCVCVCVVIYLCSCSLNYCSIEDTLNLPRDFLAIVVIPLRVVKNKLRRGTINYNHEKTNNTPEKNKSNSAFKVQGALVPALTQAWNETKVHTRRRLQCEHSNCTIRNVLWTCDVAILETCCTKTCSDVIQATKQPV